MIDNYDEIIDHDLECIKNDEPVVVYTENKNNIYVKKLCCKCFSIVLLTTLVGFIIYLNIDEIIHSEYADVAARAWPYSCYSCHHKKLMCSDLKYGCCNISSYGVIKNNETNFIQSNLDLHIISMIDDKGSNCPSYRKLINKYDEYYLKYENYDFGMKYCNSTVENCCKIDYIYDSLYRLENLGNSYNEIKKYYDNNKHQYIELNIKGKCPNSWKILTRYDNGYTDPKIGYIVFGVILSILLCIFGCSNINGNGKYKKRTRR